MIDCVKSEEQGGIPRVASPQQRIRRVSREFKDVMPKRRSLTDSKAAHYEGTPGKPKKVDESTEAGPSPMPVADFELTGFSEEKPEEVVDADHVDERGDAHNPAMVIPEDPACKVYVGNLSYKTRFQALKTHMAKPDLEIAFAGILGDDGSVDGYGWSRGFGFVIYETPEQAKAAIELLNGTELDGRKITVDFWSADDTKEESSSTSKNTWGKENGKCWQKDDWKGKSWNSRSEDDWYWNMFAQMTGQRWGQSRQHQHPRSKRGDTKVRAWVGNVNHGADWKDLRNHMKPAGDVKWAEILTRGGWQGAKSKGSGFVEYKTPEQVEQAVNSLNGTEMQGRQIFVDHWTTRSSSKSR